MVGFERQGKGQRAKAATRRLKAERLKQKEIVSGEL
jgi:hypothetical protein